MRAVVCQGWQLGEHGLWRKFTNFELGTRVPLIISAPWLNAQPAAAAAAAPRRTNAIVELVDILPTVADLAGVPLPAGEMFDGTSLLPLLSEVLQRPRWEGQAADAVAAAAAAGGQSTGTLTQVWTKDAAFSQYPKRVRSGKPAWEDNGIIHKERATFTHMGYSVRTAQWRLTQWVAWNQTVLRPLWSHPAGVVATELYDHRQTRDYPTDFNQGENTNVANQSAHAAVVAALTGRLREHFPGT